jgi:pimeloyl-ACP methyl ester carboxylesterase
LQSTLKGVDWLIRYKVDPDPFLARIIQLIRKLSGMQLRHVMTGGIRWPYLTGGCGAPVVLLHGFGADKDRFGPLPSLLRRWYRVIIPDMPGFGEHEPDWRADYSVPAQVNRLDAFLSALGLNRFHLIGISLGGYAAAYYAAMFPRRVRSLILMDSAGVRSPVLSDAFKLMLVRDQNVFLYTNEKQVQTLIDYLMFRPVRLPPRIRRHWAEQGRRSLAWRRKLFADLLADGLFRLDETARWITAPTLVIWGRQDRILHVSAAARLVEMIHRCSAYVLEGCGHIPLLEYPAPCARLCSSFLMSQTDDSQPRGIRRWLKVS